MARIFTCGFEENDVTGNSVMWNTNVGNPVIVTSGVYPDAHSGTYRMTTSALAGNSYLTRAVAVAKTSGSIYTRFYFKADDATPSALTYVMQWLSNAAAQGPTIQLTTSGTLTLTNVVNASASTTSTVLSNNTWYRIEQGSVFHDTDGLTEMRLYDDTGTLLETLQLNGGSFEATLPTNILTLRLGKTASTSVLSFDDVAINDEVVSGTQPISWCGIGKTYMLVPDSDVAITWEDSAGGTNNATFANIDDLPTAIDDATYNASDTALDAADALGDTDRYGLTNLGAAVPADATITLVDVYGRVGSSQTAATHFRFQLWDEGGTLTDGPSATCNVNGWKIATTAEHLVYMATGKTKANLDSFNAGFEPITDVLAGRPRRVSALWVNVEWTEATASLTTEYVGPVAMQRQGGVMIGRRYV